MVKTVDIYYKCDRCSLHEPASEISLSMINVSTIFSPFILDEYELPKNWVRIIARVNSTSGEYMKTYLCSKCRKEHQKLFKEFMNNKK